MPIGYADGVRRGLTNNCDVLIDGRRYPLVGTVSMDNITVDLGAARPGRCRVGASADPHRPLRRGAPDRRGHRPPAGHHQPRGAVRDLGPGAAPVPPRRGPGPVTAAAAGSRRDAVAMAIPSPSWPDRPGAWLVGGAVRDRAAGARRPPTSTWSRRGSARRRRPGARPGRGRVRLRAVGGVRRLADRRPRPRLAGRSAAAQRGDDRGGPRPPRPDHQRHRRAAGRRGLRRPLRRPGGPQRAPAARRVARRPSSAIRCGRCAWPGWPASWASRSSPATLELARAAAPGTGRRRPRAGVRRAAARGLRARPCLEGLELMDAIGRHRRGAARAGGAAGGRAEPLSPPRRVRSHPFGAGRGRSRWSATPSGCAGEDAPALARCLAEPLANDLTRGQALRFGALLHDIAKPQTRAVTPQGRVTFMGHDEAGARLGGRDPAAGCARQRAAARARRRADPPPPAPRASSCTRCRSAGAPSTTTCDAYGAGRGRRHAC